MNYLTKTIQGYIKPNQTIKQQLNLISKGCNFVYNHFLSQRIECDKQKQKQPTKEQQERELVQLKENNPWLNQIYSQILKQVVRVRVWDTWKKYKEYKAINFKAKYPRLKTDSRWYDSFSYTQNNGSFGIENDKLFIKLGSAVEKSQRKLTLKLKLNQPIQGIIKTLTIAWKNNKWLVSFGCWVEPKPTLKTNRKIGIDRGVKKLFATSEGWKYYNPRYFQKGEEQLIKLQRELSRKKQGSKNYQKKKLELARKHEKISNQIKDRNHKISRKLVNKFDLIGLEDLKVKEMTERKPNQKRKVNRYLAKSIIRASWNQLAQFFSYKVKETGKEVIVVNPKNTTQRCSSCGKLANPKVERDIEIYNCSCGLILDRDVNAAKNILYLTQNNRLGTLSTELV
ncbi:MAG: transposase IS605 [Mycoplasmataceae bacterium RV_VA103A]|nr:MAG: transposase IS605 [Mycoplasmataceae bacterium RV_VA103A]